MKNKKNHIQSSILRIAVISFSFIVFAVSSCHKAGELEPVNPGASANGAAVATNKPNIILILADDVGYSSLGVNGCTTFETPNIDMLAAQGMNFTNCYSAPLCSPSRFMFVTGQYNFRNYVNWGEMPRTQKTVANLMKSAGYATYAAGKWQFDGGDTSIRGFGYDQYCVYNPFVTGSNEDKEAGSRYKDPSLYTYGNFLPDSAVKGKYGPDLTTDSVLSFVKRNHSRNFFVYYPIALCHYPYSPTPDDPEFATWKRKDTDTLFFPSMIKYMDKKVGQIVDSLKAWGLFYNTIIMVCGDNGTPRHIHFTNNGNEVEGGKGETNETGTHVPLVVSWPKMIAEGQVNNNVVDFTDFLPTCAEAAGQAISADYGIIDGVSFYNQFLGDNSLARDWVFCHYQPNTHNGNNKLTRWINNASYKLYDSSRRLYNIALDPGETKPLKNSTLTPEEKKLKKEFQSVMDTLH